MSDWFNSYQSRLNAYGGSISGSLNNFTKDFINQRFADHPSFSIVFIDRDDVPARIVDGRDASLKTLLLQPEQEVYKGGLAEIDDKHWLIMDSIQDEIFPKALIKRCNRTIQWKDNENEDTIYKFPCVIDVLRRFDVDESRQDVNLPEGGYFVHVQFNNTTKMIQLNMRFIFGSQVFTVVGIDDVTEVIDNKGILVLAVKIDSSKDERDDFVNGIAWNSYGEIGSSGGDSHW